MNFPESFAGKVGREHSNCCRVGCENLATHHPVLVLTAIPGTTPAPMMLGIGVCPDHQPTDAQEWLTDETWEFVSRVFSAAGKMIPDRTLTTVRYDPLPAGRA